jgi:hypothetical protein
MAMPRKLALLITCPYVRLLGTENDVEKTADVLERDAFGFHMTRCCGAHTYLPMLSG